MPRTQVQVLATHTPRPHRHPPSHTRPPAALSQIVGKKYIFSVSTTTTPKPSSGHTQMAKSTPPPHTQRTRHGNAAAHRQPTPPPLSTPATVPNLHIVKNTAHSTPPGIIHCEDHFPNRLMWYRPRLTYHDAITATFTEVDVFNILHVRAMEQLTEVYTKTGYNPQRIRRCL